MAPMAAPPEGVAADAVAVDVRADDGKGDAGPAAAPPRTAARNAALMRRVQETLAPGGWSASLHGSIRDAVVAAVPSPGGGGGGVSPSAWRPPLGLALMCVACVAYVAVRTFAPEPVGALSARAGCRTPSGHCVCPREAVCAETVAEMVLLAISRGTVFLTYPLIVALFFTKCNNLRTKLSETMLSEFFPLHDLHHLHVFAGWVVGAAAGLHGVSHLIRWGLRTELRLLYEHVTGRSGAVALVCTPLVVLPMGVPWLKKKLGWEWRKGLHYLSIAWGVAVACHSPATHVGFVMGITVAMYCADFLAGMLVRTHLVRSTLFTRLERSVELTFEHPEGFKYDGTGYVYVCLPWISRWQWHAFSIFPHPWRPNHSSICVSVAGDWTEAVHHAVVRPTSRPMWVCGPFSSPYSTGFRADNMVAVASGIGITPAIALIVGEQSSTKRIHLIWACRDASLIEFYLKNVRFDETAWTLIYYTGKRPLVLDEHDETALPPTVLVFHQRPNLERVIADIVVGIETGDGLPEELVRRSDEFRIESFLAHESGARVNAVLRRILVTYSTEELFALASSSSQTAPHVDPPLGGPRPSSEGRRLSVAAVARNVEAFLGDRAAASPRAARLSFTALASSMGTVTLRGWLTTIADLAGEDANLEECELRMLKLLFERGFAERRENGSGGAKDGGEEDGAVISHSEFAAFVEQLRKSFSTEEEVADAGQTDEEDSYCQFTYPPKDRNMARDFSKQVKLAAQGIYDEYTRRARMKEMADNGQLSSWMMLYCGGARQVVGELRRISHSHKLQLQIESFDW